MLSNGSASIFFVRPISFAFMVTAIALLLLPIILRKKPIPLLLEAK